MADIAETGLYAYGVVQAPHSGGAAFAGVAGMDGHPVGLVAAGDLAAVVTQVVLPRPPGRRRDLVSHSDVLNTIVAEHDVVPLRFGTVFPDTESLVADLLTHRAPELTDVLRRTTSAVQLNLRASYVEERVLAEVVSSDPRIQALHQHTRSLPQGMPHPDLIELGRRVSDALEGLRQDDSALLTESVLPLARDSRLRERSATDHVVDIALLVGRDTLERVESELERLAEDVHERIRLELTGPLAPFDFVEEPAWA